MTPEGRGILRDDGRKGRAQGTAVRSRPRRGRAPAELGDARARSHARAGGRARLHQGRRAAAHRRAVDLRNRRRRGRADAGAQGVARGTRGGRSDCRRERRRSRRARFPPSSSPTPSSHGPVSPSRRRPRKTGTSRIAKFPWGASGRAITLDRTDGLTKLILDPKTERLLGVGLVGPGRGRADRRRRAGDRDGRERHRPQADDSSAPDADRDGHGVRRSVLRPGDSRVQTQEVTTPLTREQG